MNLPARDYQACKTVLPAKLPKGLDRLAHNLLGRSKRRTAIKKAWFRQAESIHQLSLEFNSFTDRELRNHLNRSQAVFRRQKKDHPEQQLSEALALIAEAADRSLGMRPFPVQILGALAIYHGYLAEMATGEGKTLTACLPAILFAWSGKPCHVITANDYLATRDAKEMDPLYRFCQLTTGWVSSQMSAAERKENYQRNLVYTTSKELLADYLRDKLLLGSDFQASRRRLKCRHKNTESTTQGTVMRGIDAAIIDEADSILIDEAVTPLIISQPQENKPLNQAYQAANEIICHLTRDRDYKVDFRHREVSLLPEGEQRVATLADSFDGLWKSEIRRKELVLTALTAKELYDRDKQYVIADEKVVIVDEFSGRMMPQRTWRQGLHQSVEIQEGLPLSDPSETLARLSFQRFFRLFRRLGGMTGTAHEASNELWHIYNLPVLLIPTNRPCERRYLPNRYYRDQQSKWQAICTEIESCHHLGQPVLIGTRSIDASEQLANLLTERGLAFQLLNAVKHQEEAEIIANAGECGQITIATNMAGRGADIKLGKGVAALGGLHVIVSERNESCRIDRQLLGRCARQGQPGSVRIYSSLEDNLIKRYASRQLLHFVKQRTAPPETKQRLFEAILNKAQDTAQKQAFYRRKTVMQSDDWLSNALSFARAQAYE